MNNANLVSVLTNLVKIKTLLFKETSIKGSDRIALAIKEAAEGICMIGNMLVENGEVKCGDFNRVLKQEKESKNVNDTIRVKEDDNFNRIELNKTLSKDSDNINVSGGEDCLADSKKIDRSLELKVLNCLKSYFDCPEYSPVLCADEIAIKVGSKEIKPVQEVLDNLVKTEEIAKISSVDGTYYAYNG